MPAPELYWRLDQQQVDESAPGAIEQAMGLARQIDWQTTVSDAVAALDRLAGLDDVRGTPAVVGFCFGGGLAFNVAAEAEPAALVSYYGSSLPDLLELAPQVTCPSLHHFGTADDYLDAGAVSAVAAAVTADGRPARVETYDGANHAFDNDDFVLHHPRRHVGRGRRPWPSFASTCPPDPAGWTHSPLRSSGDSWPRAPAHACRRVRSWTGGRRPAWSRDPE